VATGAPVLATSRLRRLAQRSSERERPAPTGEQCELCGEPLPPEHRHLVDLSSRGLLCACRACTLLFDHRAAGGAHYRLVPDRRRRVVDLELDDALWDRLRIPVEMAFFFRSSQAERTVAFYPGPAGAAESLLDLDAWRELEAANPVLGELEPDVEALLVNRASERPEHWLVPIDDCYDLVGLIRSHWSGLSGGPEVWAEIARFFERLGARAKAVTREGAAAQASAPATAIVAGGEERSDHG
jgi:Family of unknown function (DUF5947)